jgi:transposase-like protein
MPPSPVRPEETYDAFHTRETFTSVAKRFGIERPTLRRWWITKFGATAYEQRTKIILQTPEEKKQKLKTYREANKDLVRAQKKAWRAANTEKVKASKEAHRTAHPEETKAYFQRYYAENADKFREFSRQYRREHGDLVRQKERDYYQKQPGKLLFKNAKQRARRFGLPFEITLEDIVATIPSDGLCPITKEPFERGDGKVGPRSMSLDKINPTLGYVPGNIAIISHKANTIKQDCTDPEIFRRLATYLESFVFQKAV